MRAALVLGLVGIGATGAVAASAAYSTASQPCPKGSVAAKIAGKQLCLKAGQKCKRSLDGQYHRYRFHCHDGRLTRWAPKPPELFRRVDVGGHRLAIRCFGTGRPTIVLESGGGTSAVGSWIALVPRVTKTTRVCWYDRAGLGESEARSPLEPVPAARAVEELHRLLAGAGIAPPYVLGGWSLGGFFNRLYTKRYAAEVRGLVLVDGTPIGLPGEPSWMKPPGQPPIDLIGGPGFPDSYYYAAADAELAAAPGLGARPLVVLTHGLTGGLPDDFEALWVKWQKQVALLSSSSMLVRAEYAGHPIQSQAADLTAEAFRLVVAAVRAKRPLAACSGTRLPLLSGTCLDPTSETRQRRTT
jgi:pimeloyl-ACP methyl ester carboxylesterase